MDTCYNYYMHNILVILVCSFQISFGIEVISHLLDSFSEQICSSFITLELKKIFLRDYHCIFIFGLYL